MFLYNLNVVQNISSCYRFFFVLLPSSLSLPLHPPPLPPPRGWDQVNLRVRGCDEVIAVSWMRQQAKPMSHGSFGDKSSISHKHAHSPYSSLSSLSLTHTHRGVGLWVSRGGVRGRLCPYMGSVRLGVLWSAGNAGRFQACLVALSVRGPESKNKT